MNQPPFFSIITPTYNRAHFIMRAIESVLCQSFSNWEMIIIDDGSTDNTEMVVKKVKDPRVRYIKKKHEERSIARNFGIEKARGDYLCFLDSDDYLLENHLMAHFENISKLNFPVAAFFSGSFMEANQVKTDDTHLFANDTPVQNLWKLGFNLLPFSFHKAVFKNIRMDSELVFMEDIDMILKVFKQYKVFPIFKNTNVIVVHDERSTAECYQSDLKKYGAMYIFSIDKILHNHFNFLNQYFSKKDILNKKGAIILNFLKASIRNLNLFCTIHFAKLYINWKMKSKTKF